MVSKNTNGKIGIAVVATIILVLGVLAAVSPQNRGDSLAKSVADHKCQLIKSSSVPLATSTFIGDGPIIFSQYYRKMYLCRDPANDNLPYLMTVQ